MFSLEKSHGDASVEMYADFTSWKHAVTYQDRGDRTLNIVLVSTKDREYLDPPKIKT